MGHVLGVSPVPRACPQGVGGGGGGGGGGVATAPHSPGQNLNTLFIEFQKSHSCTNKIMFLSPQTLWRYIRTVSLGGTSGRVCGPRPPHVSCDFSVTSDAASSGLQRGVKEDDSFVPKPPNFQEESGEMWTYSHHNHRTHMVLQGENRSFIISVRSSYCNSTQGTKMVASFMDQ